MDEFIMVISDNYNSLSDKEKEIIRASKDSDFAKTLAKVLGPEIGSLLNQLAPPKAKSTGLGAR